MKTRLLVLFLMILGASLSAQVTISKPAVVSKQELASFGNPVYQKENWGITLNNFGRFDHVASVSKETFNQLKEIANLKRNSKDHQKNIRDGSTRDENLNPVMRVNFQGNIQGNNVPPDNAMAVSTNGFIVSAINSNIIFANGSGTVTFTQSLADFFTFSGANSSVYDPRILFDVEKKRFIAMALNGSSPNNTKIVLAFSKYEDPAAGWYYYSFDGNPLDADNWFDYPNVGLTDQNLFFTGLMRNDDGLWQYSVIYQIDKNLCFNGQTTNWAYYNEVFNADGEKAFNLVPAHAAWNDYPATKMYFVSNVANGGDQYHLHSIDGNVNEDLPIIAQQVTGPMTELAPDGVQPNTTNVMNTFDSRIWNAMELNGIIHFGAHVNSPENTSGIFYGRMNPNTLSVTGSLYYNKDFDYGFPSIAAIGHSEGSDTVLINMLKTGPNLFPSQVAVMCTGQGLTFNFSKEVMTKQGTSFVNVLDDNRERWGDYTTVGRRFYQETPEVWITGCYGRGSYGTWLAQYFADSTQHIIDFFASKTTINPGESTTFNWLPTDGYQFLEWKINNGSEVITDVAQPQVSYANTGTYDAAVVLRAPDGSIRTFSKEDFITVVEKVLAPVSAFSADRDTIYQGESVQFTSQAVNDPLSYSWNFANGIPSTSMEENPRIKYEKTGSFLVSLTVKNTAGSDTELKSKYITVLKAELPQADFGASVVTGQPGAQILFFDNSTNVPTEWLWTFEGGEPATSNSANPVVTFANSGVYDVGLVVSNFAGTDTIIKENYIQIGGSAVTDVSELKNVKLYPNPVSEERINLEFELMTKDHYKIDLIDAAGRLVKNIVDQKIKVGKNELSFNASNLPNGSYYLKMVNRRTKENKTFSFVKI